MVSMYVYCGVAKSKYSLILECPSLTSKCYLMVMNAQLIYEKIYF